MDIYKHSLVLTRATWNAEIPLAALISIQDQKVNTMEVSVPHPQQIEVSAHPLKYRWVPPPFRMCYQALKNKTNSHLKELEWVKDDPCITWTSSWLIHTQRNIQTDTDMQATTIPKGQNWPWVNMNHKYLWYKLLIYDSAAKSYELCLNA